MPRTCTICTHPERAAIDKALVDGQPYRDIAGRYGTSKTALQRHKEDHLRELVTQAKQRQAAHEAALGAAQREQETTRVEQALDIVKQLKAINAASVAILHEARQAGNAEIALKAVDRVLRQIEFQARLLGELDAPQVNVLLAPEWVSIRAGLLAALGPFPEARTAVAQRLLSVESANGHR
jgi:transposase